MIYEKKIHHTTEKNKEKKNAMLHTWVIEAKQENAQIKGKELPFHSKYPITMQ